MFRQHQEIEPKKTMEQMERTNHGGTDGKNYSQW